MPTYDYLCPNCNTQFKEFHSINAARPNCPECEAIPDRLFLSAPSIHGHMAQGRDKAARTFEEQESKNKHGPGCPCCH
jgi:putative FmdB family regulatory protein